MSKPPAQASPGNKAPSSDGEYPVRRGRVSLACQRCKNRKQKCDGVHPSCSNCVRFKVECQYVYPSGWKPGGKKFYIRALESRVAQLERSLSGAEHSEPGNGQTQLENLQPRNDHPLLAPPVSDQDDALLSAIRDLSLGVNGQVLGGTSTITLGRLLASLVKDQDVPELGVLESGSSDLDIMTEAPSHDRVSHVPGFSYIPNRTASRLFDSYIKNFSARFPVLHSPRIRELFERREQPLSSYDEAILHLVFATSGRFLELSGETGTFDSDSHYEAALVHMDEILARRDNLSVVYLVLLGVYSIRTAKDLGAWMYVGLATRLSIDLGLHRRMKSRKPSIRHEMDKRIFWSLYYLDREVAIAMGRPLALSDHDIDADLPLDMDEAIDEEDAIVNAAKHVSDKPCNPPTSLTSFIHHIRLKRIESEVHRSIYRVDKSFSASRHLVQGFYKRLTAWEKAIPPECRGHAQNQDTKPYDSIDVYHIVYHRACRLLLYPTLADTPVNLRHVSLCAEACGNVCDAYKRLHHSVNIAFAPLSLQNVFLAGLTLIYCIWLSPSLLSTSKLNDQLTNCVIMLYAMAERYPSARKYRDVFEGIKNSVMARVVVQPTLSGSSPSKPVTASAQANILDEEKPQPASFGDGMMEDFRMLDRDGFGTGGARDEFAWMIGELSGGGINLTRSSPGAIGPSEDWADCSPGASKGAMQLGDEEQSLLQPLGNNVEDTITVAHGNGLGGGMFDYDALGDEWSVPIPNPSCMENDGLEFEEWGVPVGG